MRVSDNTSRNAVQDALGRTRSKIEDLQLKNATLKKLNAPSDDPVANSKIMSIRTQSVINHQYDSNASAAKERLQHTENAIQEVTDILVRAKEIALNQASGPSATQDSRLGVAQEVSQLYKQVVAIANRRSGDYYIFGGFKTLNPPYAIDGQFRGDEGQIPLEIQKGVTVNSNIPGPKVFKILRYSESKVPEVAMAEDGKELLAAGAAIAREPASAHSPSELPVTQALEEFDLFKVLETLRVGLLTNDTISIRSTIDSLDHLTRNSISVRAKIGSRLMGIDNSLASTEKTNLQNAAVASQLEDADYAELWSNLAKEETVLRSSLSAAQKLIQPTLLEFLR